MFANNPNAPKILYRTYFQEKVSFAGIFVSSILYGTCKKSTPCPCSLEFVRFTLGIIIVLFFKCMVALYNPDHCRKRPIKWGLVSYTTAMFLLATVGTVTQLDVQSLSYIDHRQFPGAEEGSGTTLTRGNGQCLSMNPGSEVGPLAERNIDAGRGAALVWC